MSFMENTLDEASLREWKVFPLKEIKYLWWNFTSSESCYLKVGLVSVMPKCCNKDGRVEFYKDVLGSIKNSGTI